MQDQDSRIFIIATYEPIARQIICEVSLIMINLSSQLYFSVCVCFHVKNIVHAHTREKIWVTDDNDMTTSLSIIIICSAYS